VAIHGAAPAIDCIKIGQVAMIGAMAAMMSVVQCGVAVNGQMGDGASRLLYGGITPRSAR
jgi:hypothetical protein